MPLVYDEIRKIASNHLCNGKTILEIGAGDNLEPFRALYPLVHPSGQYVIADPLYAGLVYKEAVAERIGSSFSPQKVNFKLLGLRGQDEEIPPFDLAVANELNNFLLYAEEIVPILQNLAIRKKPNARLLLIERCSENYSILDDVAHANSDKTVREICHQRLNSIEEGRIISNEKYVSDKYVSDYEYLIGRL